MRGRENREMQRAEVSEVELQKGERWCLQCQKSKPFSAFSGRKGKMHEHKKICCACEQFNQDERHRRLATQSKTRQQQQEWEKRKQQEWERRVALRRAHEQRQREKEHWYLQQPDRRCQMCHHLLPASAFGGIFSANDFILHTRCATCHEALRARSQLACCLCQEKTSRRNFLSSYEGYALCGDGAWISLCCRECESTFSSSSRCSTRDVHSYLLSEKLSPWAGHLCRSRSRGGRHPLCGTHKQAPASSCTAPERCLTDHRPVGSGKKDMVHTGQLDVRPFREGTHALHAHPPER